MSNSRKPEKDKAAARLAGLSVDHLRAELVAMALYWQERFGVAPSITTAISELDAAFCLVGVDENDEKYRSEVVTKTAVTPGFDFTWDKKRYQITANRPSGKPGSKVTLVNHKKENDGKRFGWDILIWILYDEHYNMQHASMFTAAEYRRKFKNRKRLGPADMKEGTPLFPKAAKQ